MRWHAVDIATHEHFQKATEIDVYQGLSNRTVGGEGRQRIYRVLENMQKQS